MFPLQTQPFSWQPEAFIETECYKYIDFNFNSGTNMECNWDPTLKIGQTKH